MPRIKQYSKKYKMNDFSTWVIGQIATKNLKQSDVAKAIGIRQQGLSDRLTGKVEFRLSEIIALFEFLETDETTAGHLFII